MKAGRILIAAVMALFLISVLFVTLYVVGGIGWARYVIYVAVPLGAITSMVGAVLALAGKIDIK